MSRLTPVLLPLFVLSVSAGPILAQYGSDDSAIAIANAVLPIPEDLRAGAEVLGQSESGEISVLREGSNEMVCVADRPGDDRFQVICYHESLAPMIARGCELRADSVEDVNGQRHAEMDAGDLAKPELGATLYNMTMDLDKFDPETASTTLYSIYTPYATAASTGLPSSPSAPGAPWMMRAGTASSHIMVIVPKMAHDEAP